MELQMNFLSVDQCPGRFVGITVWDPSVSKTFRMSFILFEVYSIDSYITGGKFPVVLMNFNR